MRTLIIACGNNATVHFAAEELYRYLFKMDPKTDAAISVADVYELGRSHVIWIGETFFFGILMTATNESDHDDAIHIDVKDGNGIVAGNNPRSVLIAVYRFLRENGVRFLGPDESREQFPSRSAFQLHASVHETAFLRHRGLCAEGGFSYTHALNLINWIPKLGLNEFFFEFFNQYVCYARWYSPSHNPYLENEPITREDARRFRNELVNEMKKRGILFHAVGHGWNCEPFRIPNEFGDNWCGYPAEVNDSFRSVLAQRNGVRDFYNDSPLYTNLCYGNPEVRDKIINSVVDYAEVHPEIDYLHFWLGDCANNHCECPLCENTDPSDFYVRILNDLDQRLTDRNLSTRIVFLVYMDLLWAPKKEKLRHTGRFTMMFAPITRKYDVSYCPGKCFNGTIPPYQRNHNKLPEDPSEFLAMLKKWQSLFQGDSFCFDYHFMWEHFIDPGYVHISKILMEDVRNMKDIGLNGLMSVQCSRAFLPNRLGVFVMAAAMWDKDAVFEATARAYFSDEYGDDGELAYEYLAKLSHLSSTAALDAQTGDAVEKLLHTFQPVINRNTTDQVRGEAWKALSCHAPLALAIAKFKSALVTGGAANEAIIEAIDEGMRVEAEMPDRFDGWVFRSFISSLLGSKNH